MLYSLTRLAPLSPDMASFMSTRPTLGDTNNANSANRANSINRANSVAPLLVSSRQGLGKSTFCRLLTAGDWLRVAPAAKRAIRALPTEAMRFICIQTKCGSLEGFTMTDGIPCEEKAPWH